MKSVLPLETMTTTEKLQALEELWQDLSKPESRYESPDWHADVLEERDEKLKKGEDTFVPFEQVRDELDKRRNR